MAQDGRNKQQGSDGKWRSLDGRALFAAAVSLSERYNTRIEDELRARLGVRFTERTGDAADRRPVREIDGMPLTLIGAFSKRRRGIEQQYQELLASYRNQHGRDPADPVRYQLYQQATLTERPEKQRGRSLQQMVNQWQHEAETVLGRPDAGAEVERRCLHRLGNEEFPEPGPLADRVLSALAESRATWTVHHIRAEAHRQSRPYLTADREQLVEAVVAATTHPSRSIRIETPRTLPEPAELRRADGESVFVEHAATRFTTTVILDAEERIAGHARAMTAQRLGPDQVSSALARSAREGRTLNPDQTVLARVFCSSGRVVQLGLAPAGAGKTTAMRVVVDAWSSSGRPVVALAPSAVAADILKSELNVGADTLAKFDHDQPAICPGTMILIDEAGMAGTLALDRIIGRAVAAGGVVRLLGDDQQLGAVEAGGVLRQLAHDVGAVRMTQVVRFADPEEAAAALRIREGDGNAVDFYLGHDRVVAGTSATAQDVAYAAWLADVRAGRDSLLLATSSAEVSALNAHARADLVVAGQVAVDGVSLRDGNVAGVGDRISTRRNSRLLAVHDGRDWVKNGDSWRVLAVHDDGAMTVAHRRHRGRVTLPEEYVRAHVELDYARTIRRAQGMTVDHAHLLVTPQLSREDLYVGLTRARFGTRLYVATITERGVDHLPDVAGGTRDVLRGIIARSGLEPSASEAIREAVAGIGDLRRMAVEYEHALGVHVGDRYRTVAEAAHPGITADPYWPSVAHRLHLAEGVGWSPGDVLARAAGMGGYADARSDTQVLSYRLDRLLEHRESRRTTSEEQPPAPAWLAARPPAQLDAPWRTYLPGRYEEMADRITSLAVQAHREPAHWLSAVGLGPQRDEAIRQVVAYREVYAVTSPDPLGPEPDLRSRQHQAWTAATRAVAGSHQATRPPGNGAARLLTELTATPAATDDYRADSASRGPTRHL